LIIAAIFAAAMSSISAELNALATATTIDFYRRHYKPTADDRHYVKVGRVATGLWGIFACVVALYATSLGSLIEVVNRFGSFFYGSLLGVFVLAVAVPRARARGAFWGLITGVASGLDREPLHGHRLSLVQRHRLPRRRRRRLSVEFDGAGTGANCLRPL
jgi:Na+/proline symporter